MGVDLKRLRHILSEMKTVFALLAPACLAAFASANPVDRTGCSITELLACQNEINQAMEDCGHLNSIQDIQTCVNDILAATDCQVHLRCHPWTLLKTALNRYFDIN